MKNVTTVGSHQIFQKRSGRYAVQGKDKKWVNGDEKTRILLDAGLVQPPKSKATPAEPPAEEPAA
jgi:hypothetical protein